MVSRLPVAFQCTLTAIKLVEQADDFGQSPNVRRNAGFHCRSNPESLVDATKVVVHEVERHGGLEVLDLLGEGIGEPGETHYRPLTSLDKRKRHRLESVALR